MIPEFFVLSRFDNLDRFWTTIRAQNWAFKSRRLKFDVIQRIGLYVITSIMMFHDGGFRNYWQNNLAKADSIATERPTKTHTFPFSRKKMRQSYMVASLKKKIQKLVLNFQINAMISGGQLVCVISVQTIHVIDTREWAVVSWVPNFGTNSSLVKLFIGKTVISCIWKYLHM